MSASLGEKLVERGIINKDQLKHALETAKKTKKQLGTILVDSGTITETQYTEFLSEHFGIPAVDPSQFDIDASVIKLIPVDVAREHNVVPVARQGATLTVAMTDPTNIYALDDIKFITGYHVEPVVASENSILAAINKYYATGKALASTSSGLGSAGSGVEGGSGTDFDVDLMENVEDSEDVNIEVGDFEELVSSAVEDVEVVEEVDDDSVVTEVDAPIVKLVNGILLKAIKMGISDIHVEPYEKSYRIRYRLDGVLHKELGLPLKIRSAVTTRLKILSSMDIAERRLPQDGRIKLKLGKKRDMDFRVSSIPTLFGEKIVLRLLDKSNLQLDMTNLGFTDKQLADFQEAIHKPYGMVLVTGPTGSGKTTTLYSALNQLNKVSVNLCTAEDPVEYNVPGINQVQMKEQIGLNFAAALRSFLRQDPDIIMVGEIRDFETAEIAIKAALTGHLVLSTIHTNDAPSTINRLLNMGIEPFLVSSSLILILAQRLTRRICDNCKEVEDIPVESLISVGFSPDEAKDLTMYRGKGCSKCGNTGYKGRIALYEVMPITDNIRELIVRGASNIELKEAAKSDGMMTLRESGLQKIREGVTTLEECVRVTFGE